MRLNLLMMLKSCLRFFAAESMFTRLWSKPAAERPLDELIYRERAFLHETKALPAPRKRYPVPILLFRERHIVAEAVQRIVQHPSEQYTVHLLEKEHVWRVVLNQLFKDPPPAIRVVSAQSNWTL